MKKNICKLLLLIFLATGIYSCRDTEEPTDAEMNDTIQGPSILKEVDDASTYMSDTNRITVEDSARNAGKNLK